MVLEKKLISIVIPIYKKENIIKHCLKNITELMDQFSKDFDIDYEILTVIDGKLDLSEEKIKEFILESKNSKIKLYPYSINRGKGFAVRYGMIKARGDFVGFIDAGLDIDVTVVVDMVKKLLDNTDTHIVVASKKHPNSKLIYPLKRKLMTYGYSLISKVFTSINYNDTQVGAKFFTKELLWKVLPRLLVKRYAFDVELLAVSTQLGFTKHIDVPVNIDFTIDPSSATNFTQIFKMIWDTVAVGYRLKVLNYYRDQNYKMWGDSLFDLLKD